MHMRTAPARAMLLVWLLCVCVCTLAAPRAGRLSSRPGFTTDTSTGITTFVRADNSTRHPSPRQLTPGGIFSALLGAANFVDQFTTILKNDKSARGEYTKRLVTGVRERYPYFNVVVCHGDHTFKWDGVEGTDWLHQHKEFDIKAGGTIGYEMYIARSGTFQNNGDGGYSNWAYGGNIAEAGDGGSLVFGPYAMPRGKSSTYELGS